MLALLHTIGEVTRAKLEIKPVGLPQFVPQAWHSRLVPTEIYRNSTKALALVWLACHNLATYGRVVPLPIAQHFATPGAPSLAAL